ncbi:MAG: YdcF family protein [Nitrospirae bacterium]|nr:YdcF family protein [Nitrospirota bacterium]
MFKCLKFIIMLLILAALVFFGHGFVLERAGGYLLKKDELKPADVIVIVSGEEKERVEYGVKLFKEEWARKNRIIMSGGSGVWKYTWASLMKEHAESLGVPGKAILVEDRSRTIEENARYTKELLKKHGYKSLILVTSPYHSKRASIVFRKVFGGNFKIINAPVPVEESWFRFDQWWKKPRSRDMVLTEYSKFIKLWIFGVGTPEPSESEE